VISHYEIKVTSRIRGEGGNRACMKERKRAQERQVKRENKVK